MGRYLGVEVTELSREDDATRKGVLTASMLARLAAAAPPYRTGWAGRLCGRGALVDAAQQLITAVASRRGE